MSISVNNSIDTRGKNIVGLVPPQIDEKSTFLRLLSTFGSQCNTYLI